MQAWRLGAVDQQAKIAKLMAAAKRWHQPLLCDAFHAWLGRVRCKREAAGQLQQALAHWLNATLSSGFNTWRYQVSLQGWWCGLDGGAVPGVVPY